MMKTLAFILNLVGLVLAISASLIKGEKMKKTLLLILLGNLLVAISYLISGVGINGAASGILACIQIAINYVFESKNKPIPKWLIAIYVVLFIAVNIWVGGIAIPTIFAILACLAFIASIVQKNGKSFRACVIINTVFWIIYDIFVFSVNGLITHCSILVMNIIGVLMHDLKIKKKN